MTRPPPLDRAIAAAREATGTRWCIGCAKHRQTDGGRVRIGGNGARIWRCAQCSRRANQKGFR